MLNISRMSQLKRARSNAASYPLNIFRPTLIFYTTTVAQNSQNPRLLARGLQWYSLH